MEEFGIERRFFLSELDTLSFKIFFGLVSQGFKQLFGSFLAFGKNIGFFVRFPEGVAGLLQPGVAESVLFRAAMVMLFHIARTTMKVKAIMAAITTQAAISTSVIIFKIVFGLNIDKCDNSLTGM